MNPESQARNQMSELLRQAEGNPSAFNPNQLASTIGNNYGKWISPQEYLGAIQNIYGTNWGGGSSAPGGGGGGGGPQYAEFNEAGARNTARAIEQLPSILARALASNRNSFQNARNQFNTQEQGQRKTYDKSTTTNQQNYDANFMDSIRAGIKGIGGLMQILRGTGAAGGTAEDEARDVVGGVTSNDIRTGADTREENQTALDTSLEGFLTELQRKRQIAEDTKINNARAAQRDYFTQMQDLFGKMAGFDAEAGNKAGSNSWMTRAGNLTPKIAANSGTKTSLYDTSPVAVKAPELTAFADPSQPSVVTAPGGQVGSGIFTMMDPRRRREQAVPVGV